MEEFEYDGYWWLPENQDTKIPGTLRFHPLEGATLELIGTFKDFKDINTVLQPIIILGSTPNGKIITLYNCYESQSKFSFPGFLISSYIATVIFLGHHFEKEEDIIFDSLSLSYSHLEEWSGITGFQSNIETDSNNHLTKHEVSYIFPKKVEVHLDNLNVSFDYEFTFGGDRIKEFNLKQTMFIKIEPHKQIHFNDYQSNICYHIQNFLSLAMGRAVYPLLVKGKTKAAKFESSNGEVVHKDIHVFHKMRDLCDLSKKLHPHDMLFSFGDISNNFERCLSNWFTKSDALRPVYDLYFGTLYNSSMYLQHEFLSLVQAIESYHRRVYNGKYLSGVDYQEIYETLVEAIPRDVDKNFKDSLRQKMIYLNEFSLRTRLKEILKKCGDMVNLLIRDHAVFIEDVLNTMNFLTHYDITLEMKAKTGQELFQLVQKLKYILEICFLIELEMPPESIKVLANRNRRNRGVIY